MELGDKNTDFRSTKKVFGRQKNFWSVIPFLSSSGFRLDLRPLKVYLFELSVNFLIDG
jgi:hypothetical protein